MPGPDGPWGHLLEAAVRDGAVPVAVIDEKVDRLVRLRTRVGAMGDTAAQRAPDDLPTRPETRALLREGAARCTVVLNNDGVLPLDAAGISSVALIGPNATEPFVQGGGSAFVNAPHLFSPLDALRDALPGAAVTIHRGASGRAHA